MGSFTAPFHLVILLIFHLQQPKVIPKVLITTTKQTSKQTKQKELLPSFSCHIVFTHLQHYIALFTEIIHSLFMPISCSITNTSYVCA